MGCRGGGNFDKMNVFDKRNVVVESMGCRGGGNCDKSNVFDKRNVVVESMGCRGGENCDKRNVFDKRNVVESMGCRGEGKILIKGSQVGSHKGKCVSAMLRAAEGGKF